MEKGELNWAVIGCGVIADEMTKLRKEWGLKYPNELWLYPLNDSNKSKGTGFNWKPMPFLSLVLP